MHRWTVRAARVALVAAAFTAAGAGVANADNTTGDHSLLGGEQIHIPIIAPIGLFGNNINLFSGSSVPAGYRLSHLRMADPDPAYAPQMEICGNAIAGSNGVGTATCTGSATPGGESDAPAAAHAAPPAAVHAAPPAAVHAAAPAAVHAAAPAAAHAAAAPMAPSITPIGAPAIPIGAPVAATAEAPASAEGPMAAQATAPEVAAPATSMSAPADEPITAPVREMSTSGESGIMSGNQVKAPVRVPIRICGNAAALGGVATAACEGTASSGRFGVAHRAFRTLRAAGLSG